jgi:hypothetical protein
MGHRPNPIELFQFEEPQLIGGTILSYDPRDAKVGYIHSEAQEGNIYCRPGNLCQIIEIEGRLYFSLNHRLEIQPQTPGVTLAGDRLEQDRLQLLSQYKLFPAGQE